ncbi:MAG: Fe-S cluster assembly protein SufD [Bacteroidales bacterium]|nr:Fe-S cluster assembly protein SufD [Bacteroidales bacterium]
MIRKDILPDVWTDGWRCEAPQQRLEVGRREELQLVLCHRQDAPMFMLREGQGYRIMEDIEHMAVAMDEGARLKLYRLQGMNTPARHLTQLDITMQRDAELEMCTVTLGGGHVRNNVVVRMQGEGCRCQADGLYLIDREQECDNYIFVEHAKPHCTSRELYKGIMDDAARARFNGHVLVQDGAAKTEAYQTNRNILLTDKAHVDTRPFLEIYNDDVKCSHGSTIGQLDEQAMFYLQTRGISERTAVTMLSYAFCDEVIRGIAIEGLRDTVGDMVKKRLHGELTPSCDECSIRCTTPCNGEAANFRIDPSKL